MAIQATYMTTTFVQLMAQRLVSITGIAFLNLTPEQLSAARACGFAFFPATEVQVQRLTMQKRIFSLADQPFLATRDGTYWETHGTVMRRIAEQVRSGPQSVVEASEQVPHSQEIPEDTGVSAAEVPPEMAEAPPDADPTTDTQVLTETPTTRRRSAGRSRARKPGEAAAIDNVDAPLPAARTMDPSDSAEVPMKAEAAAPEQRDAPAARQRRARKLKTPSSVTVGTQETAEDRGLEASPTKKDDASAALRPSDRGPEGGSIDAPVANMAAMDPPKVAQVSGEVRSGGTEGHRVRVVRRPLLRQPKIPRWVTAGKERRGRLK
jgi:hypothetical protein